MRKPSATFVLDERLARRKKTFLMSMAAQNATLADDPVAVVARNRAVRVLARCGLDSGPYSRAHPLPAEESGMRIGEVARAAGVGIDAVRFYEREGLIRAARRPSGYREYTPDVVVSLRFIRRAKELGFTLKEIAELLRLETTAGATPSDVRVRAEAKLEDLEERIRALQRMRRALRRLVEKCPGKGPLKECSILRALAPEAGRPR